MRERNYEFRRRLNIVHKPNRHSANARPECGEVAVDHGWQICISPGSSDYLQAVAKDLQDYLFTSMEVSTLLRVSDSLQQTPRTIVLTTKAESPELGRELSVSKSYRIVVDPDGIIICGCDERGVAQGCYFIEDLMNLREAPFLSRTDTIRTPLFSPRMVHSGWGLDQYPDPHLNAIAHAGFDSILLFVKGVDMTTTGYLDINNLIDRAALHGIDVYLYSYLVSRYHLEDQEAEAYYESTYGALIKSCPRAKGIVLVGESCEFPSKDPHTTQRLRDDPMQDGRLGPLPSPGWWPCTDFPQWLDLLKRITRKYNPDLDIVFWTYNWGWTPEEDRLALIRSLPTDITLQATFEMFEDIVKDGLVTRCVDYTVSFEGPGKYFVSEAQAAHDRGLRLYTMCNTGGLTWDIGVIPYEPVPFQWQRRYQALIEAHNNWGLSGLMESHHFGLWPSFVSELTKWAYWEPAVSMEEMTARIARRDFGPEGFRPALEAWQAWSNAIRDYVPTDEDQYGPFRIGPSYPLHLDSEPEPIPATPYAYLGSAIVFSDYRPHKPEDVEAEICQLERMAAGWQDGVSRLSEAVELTPEDKRTEARRMLGLGRFILNCIRTVINTKRWWQHKQRLASETDPARFYAILDDMVALANEEIANAEATIPLVEADSRLGWEPSMEYMTDRTHLEWKIALLRRTVDVTIPGLRKTGKYAISAGKEQAHD